MNTVQKTTHIREELIELRHRLHREPEIGLRLPRTQQKVLEFLDGLPLEITLGSNTDSITAVLRGTRSRRGHESGSGNAPAVLLRGDMDALPIQERTDLAFRSRFDGVMHACGHDTHTSMLAGAARVLAENTDSLPGDVVFMFQPGEEGYNGAGLMIEEGVLEASGRKVDAAYGIHSMAANGPKQGFSTKPGPMMSSADGLFVTVRGSGGHGSAPHAAKDPISVMATMIDQLQILVTRQLNAFDPTVISVGVINAGTLRNIIPDTAHFEATVRTFSAEQKIAAKNAIVRLLKGLAYSRGVEVDIEYIDEFPATINNVDETIFAEQVIGETFGPHRHLRLEQPVGASEDFSRVLNQVPGTFVFLNAEDHGASDDNSSAPAFNHSPYATFSDDILTDGAALYAQMAVSKLEALAEDRTLQMECPAIGTRRNNV